MQQKNARTEHRRTFRADTVRQGRTHGEWIDHNRRDEESLQDRIAGRNAVVETIKSGRVIDTLYLSGEDSPALSRIAAMAREANPSVVVKKTNDQKLLQLSGVSNHQGVVAICACVPYAQLEDVFARAQDKGHPPLLLIADRLEDPHNLGALIRTAEAAGADGVIIPKRRSASLTAIVYKTSAGAASHIPVVRVANLASTIDELKARGVWVYAADMDGESLYRTRFDGPCALVIGAEGGGVGRLVKEKCDGVVSIPMMGQINSLNASVAGAVVLYEVVRQRLAKQLKP